MPEPAFERCLDLCAQATGAHGGRLARTLVELEGELKRLREEASLPALDPSETAPDFDEMPLITMDLDGYLTGWNKGAQDLFGYSAGEALGQHILFLYADEPGDQNCEIHELFLNHGSPMIEVRRRKKSGETFRANLLLTRVLDENDSPTGLIASLSEIPDRLTARDKERLYARIIEDSEEGILIIDQSERIVSVNSAFTRITGFSATEAIGETPDILRSAIHGNDFRSQVYSAMQGNGAWHGEIIGKRKNGEMFPQSVSIGVVRNAEEQITHAFAIFSDISVLRAAEQRMLQLANYDSLTGLPNRSLFQQLVEQTLAVAGRKEGHGALMVVNLNQFTKVNDTLGHEAGDELLRQVGQRLRQALRKDDILARTGGDEFVIALVNIQKREHGGLVAEKLLSTLEEPFLIDSHAVHIRASIGISVFPEDGQSTNTLLRFADVAMKRIGKNSESAYLFYNPEMNVRAKEQWHLESELRRALSEGGLLLHYQPKVSLRSGRIVGAEALLRWPHPEQGMIPPGKFVPLAEETGLIFELGNWILEEACRQIRMWLDRNLERVPIAINLSARQFDAHLPERMQEAIERHGIPSDLLRLEITESLLVREPEKTISIMNRLVALGFGLSLDDFGTGYSSLAYLKKFPISTLKIDRSFVTGVPADQNDCAIAQAIVTMGKQLRQEIVAEGVESLEQMAFMRSLGCDQLQGFLFSKAVPADTFEAMVRDNRRLSLD